MTSEEKRNSVKRNYDLIAEQYGKDFGTYIEDLDVYKNFEKELSKQATILDLGAGTGRTYSYFSKKGYNYIGLDFSSKMKEEAFKIHGEFSYILDDMINIKKYFKNDSIDAVFAAYSLFHLPEEDLKKVLSDIYDILKDNGVFLFTYQLGTGEEFANEPYLGKKGKNALYMNYHSNKEMESFLKPFKYIELYKNEKTETVNGAINSNDNVTAYRLIKKKI